MNSVPLLRWAGARELDILDLAAFESGQWIDVSCKYDMYWKFLGMHVKHSAVVTLVLVCPFCLFTLLSFPSPSFMTVTDEVCFTQSSHYMHKECILASLFYCFWCCTWGTHSLWAHHTTPLCDGWWCLSVRQLRVTAPACWSRETLLVLYMSWNFNSGNYLFTTDTK